MNRFLRIFLLLLAAHVTGCQSSKSIGVVDERAALLHAARSVGVDSLAPAVDSVTVMPRPTLLQKLRGKAPVPYRVPAGTVVKTGKKATVNIYKAAVTTTTIGKKATAATGAAAHIAIAGKKAQQATDSAAAVSTGGGAAAVGTGASASGGAAPAEAPGFWATIAKPLGYVGAAAAALAGCYLLYLIWGFLPRRKKDDA